ncbi:hypothetical protein KAR48_11405 [bacterium]|nr:hypothetical protein [bacterium]
MKTKNNFQAEALSDIPKTGRIGRFAKILEKEVSEDTLKKIMQDSDKYNSLKPDKKALWWKNSIENMESELGKIKSITIMNACGEKCCGKGQRKTARRLMNESKSVEEFLDKISKYGVKEGELEYRLVDGNTIIGKHNKCFCGQVKQSKVKFKNDIYCQCSVAFNRQFFQAAFNKPVEVELKQSILNGADCCEFVISIPSWD